ncbi:selenocysteine-specific elongation factor [Periplaneta americana]|uniref:selenocysteine-specific elongation factor n=1 Tax=Periplaneta americana TaxID=6978 RepID=UPI0037E76398
MSDSILNLNIGILGHVDSGKTSLAKALSTTGSTASFDKNPQSQERGITIDLGFSSFFIDVPDHLKSLLSIEKIQITLVDCPGHASLIRTIIGGAQIIDLMMLVVDVTKGVQTQTAECLVIGEVTCQKMIVVLNKTDLLPAEKRSSITEKMKKKMKHTLAGSVFKDAPVVSVAAKPGGPEAPESCTPEGLGDLIEELRKLAFLPERLTSSPFLFAVDHCFGVRGQGTVMTGTVLQGSISINDTVEIPSMNVTKKVKSIQMFKKPVDRAMQGDRIGLCVTQFDPKQLERGIASMPGYVTFVWAAIISVQKIKYFKDNVKTKAKFHISMGHETVMAKLSFFGSTRDDNLTSFDYKQEYKFQDELTGNDEDPPSRQYALLEFNQPVIAVPRCLVIGSKLDTDIHSNTCRLAFWGHLLDGIDNKNYQATVLPDLKVYKEKCKTGTVDRASNEYEVIGRNLFKKETNIQLFVGLKVCLSTGETGIIEGSFGQSGKVKIHVPDGLKEATLSQLSATTKKRGKQVEPNKPTSDSQPVQIVLRFRRYVYDTNKKIIQL